MRNDPPSHEPPAGLDAGRLRFLRSTDYRSMPWKNGGGVTHEIARMPVEGDVFDWRLSMARIERPGPFSDFSGYRRTMLLLDGAGFVLRSPDLADRVFRPGGDAQVFDGALRIHCDLLGGPCTDLNLMVRDSIATSSRIARIDATLTLHARGTLILFVLQGACRVLADGQTADPAVRDTIIAGAGARVELRAMPGCTVPPAMFISDVG